MCECAWNATGDKDELAKLPVALSMLLECQAKEEAAGGAWLLAAFSEITFCFRC